MTYEENTSGWDAIDKAIGELYGEQESHHYGTSIPYILGGPDPLDGISVYAVNTPMPHWHFVTYGFSELYEKEMQDASKSGYGFELTFRLTRSEGETDPPAWALNLLQNVGRYVFTSGNIFQPGDYMDANGPICLESDTLLTALSFIEDPDLTAISTPNGSVQFIQMVGITGRELEMIQTWNARGFLSACSNFMPKYVTDLMRNSYADIPSVVQAVEHGMEQDGSSTAFLFVQQLGWESPRKKMLIKTVPGKLQLGAKQAVLVGTILRSRISKGTSLSLIGPDTTILFEAGEHPAVLESDRQVTLTVNEKIVEDLAENLRPVEGTFEITSMDHMLVQIVKTEIKNQEGQVIKTIG
ncbi:suppressor of fused domain protein [Paenibacillus sp. FSL K6-4396]|uniref:suppressor of fused domain protein n=1 Tax=Paenibacillus sp. FSL K6-4396 TaxID=2921506 RepID=UPI0030FA249C